MKNPMIEEIKNNMIEAIKANFKNTVSIKHKETIHLMRGQAGSLIVTEVKHGDGFVLNIGLRQQSFDDLLEAFRKYKIKSYPNHIEIEE